MKGLALLLLMPGAAIATDGVLTLNPKRTHISIDMDSGLPPARFFPSKGLRGKPVLELTDRGLFAEGRLVCAWPGGRFEAAQAANMVLGYSSLEFLKPGGRSTYKSCPRDLPVKSTWGDGGTGAAALLFEVEAVEKDFARARYGRRRRTVYLDMRPLAGRFRVETPGSLSNVPGD